MTMTAAKCDEWVATTPGDEAAVALSVLNVLVKQGWVSRNSGVDLDALRKLTADFEPAAVAQKTGVSAESIMRMGESFGQSESAVAMAGTDDPALHNAVAILNAVTGNVGKTVVFADGAPAPASSPEEIEALVKAMAGGEIDVLVIAGNNNPLFSMPVAQKFKDAIAKVGFVAWMGTVPDETAAAAHLRIPIDHSLETWHDTQPRAGVHGLGQPVMVRVFDSRPLGDLLLASAHAGGAKAEQVPWENTADAVNAAWQELGSKAGGTASTNFGRRRAARADTTKRSRLADVKLDSKVFEANVPAPQAATGLTLIAVPHIFFYDGRGANKPWLQEIPEPVVQLVWDSWVQIHPDTARSLGVSQNGIVRAALGGRRDRGARDDFRARPPGRARSANRTGPYRVWTLCQRQRRQRLVAAAAMEQGGRGQGASAPATCAGWSRRCSWPIRWSAVSCRPSVSTTSPRACCRHPTNPSRRSLTSCTRRSTTRCTSGQ